MNDMRRKIGQTPALEVQAMHTPGTSLDVMAKQNERRSIIKPALFVLGMIAAVAALVTSYLGGRHQGTEVMRAQIMGVKTDHVEARIGEIQDQINAIKQEEMAEIWEVVNRLSDVADENKQRLNALQEDIIDDLTGIKRQQLEMNKSLNTLSAFRSNQRARAEGIRVINRIDREKATF